MEFYSMQSLQDKKKHVILHIGTNNLDLVLELENIKVNRVNQAIKNNKRNLAVPT